MALSRRTGGRSRLTLALLVLTSITLLTLDFRDADGRAERAPRRRHGVLAAPRRRRDRVVAVPQRLARRSPTTATSRTRTTSSASSSTSSRASEVARGGRRRASSPSSSSSRTSSGSGAIDTTTARVLSSDPSNFSHTIDISKGSDDGLKVGMPVVTGAGLVGRVVQVTPSRSTVQLITDPDFLVGVRLLGSDLATGTAHGQGPGRGPPRRHAPRARHRRPAQARHRAHHERRAAQRVPRLDPGRARCARCRETGGGLTLELVVRPMADTERLQFVTVLLWEPPP